MKIIYSHKWYFLRLFLKELLMSRLYLEGKTQCIFMDIDKKWELAFMTQHYTVHLENYLYK